MNKKIGLVFCITGIIFIGVGIFLGIMKKENQIVISNNEEEIVNNQSFNINLIKNTYEKNNYLISPYSIFVALNMLRDGAVDNSKKELDNVLGNRKINDISITDKLSIANALFIKNQYKNAVKNSFSEGLINNYHAEILYDEFNTPEVINTWVNEKTNGMIPSILNRMSPNFVLGLANAVALDIKWQQKFECINTRSGEFTKNDGSKINVEMMHDSYKNEDIKYIKENDLEGIILPYEKTNNSDTQLEFIALMPKNIDSFINEISDSTLDEIDKKSKNSNQDTEVILSLPRFTYSYEIENFIDVLKKMGIKEIFNSNNASLFNIIAKEDIANNLYVATAIHKTKIELMETGTKAAAVTFFGIDANSLPEQPQTTIDIIFNKPFIYMIREAKTKEIIFFGAVYEPNIWQGSTCTYENQE